MNWSYKAIFRRTGDVLSQNQLLVQGLQSQVLPGGKSNSKSENNDQPWDVGIPKVQTTWLCQSSSIFPVGSLLVFEEQAGWPEVRW